MISTCSALLYCFISCREQWEPCRKTTTEKQCISFAGPWHPTQIPIIFVSKTLTTCFLRLQLSPLKATVPWPRSGQWHCSWGAGAVPWFQCVQSEARQQHRASLTVYPVMVLACCFGIFHCTLNAVQFSESSRISTGGPSLSAKNKTVLYKES